MGKRNMTMVAAATLLGLPAMAVSAAQHPPRSLYTSIALKNCRVVKKHADGNAWICQGLQRMPVYVAEGDSRFFVAAGSNATKHRAAQQTLASFNTPLDPKTSRITVEWRVDAKARKPEPYAMIVRYFTNGDKGKGEVLVVSRIAQGQSCHVAYVDATENAEAIVLARTIADERGTKFDCANEPEWVGAGAKGAR